VGATFDKELRADFLNVSNEFHRRLSRSAFDNIVLSLPTMKTTDPKAPPFSMYDELVIQVGSEFAVG
jgi:hypothetical protein